MSQWQLPPLSAWAPDIIAPHPNSWVAFIASTFRVVAYIILTPIILFTLTDIAAYAVARTLGWSLDTDPQADPDAVQKPKEAPMTGSPEPKIEANPDQTAQDSGPAPPQIALPPSPPTFAADLRFTVPGEANYELSGMFSPPISRAGSPGLSRRMRSSSTSLSAAGSDSEGPGGEMRLGVGKLGMTPVDGSTLRAPDGVARRRPARRASES